MFTKNIFSQTVEIWEIPVGKALGSWHCDCGGSPEISLTRQKITLSALKPRGYGWNMGTCLCVWGGGGRWNVGVPSLIVYCVNDCPRDFHSTTRTPRAHTVMFARGHTCMHAYKNRYACTHTYHKSHTQESDWWFLLAQMNTLKLSGFVFQNEKRENTPVLGLLLYTYRTITTKVQQEQQQRQNTHVHKPKDKKIIRGLKLVYKKQNFTKAF